MSKRAGALLALNIVLALTGLAHAPVLRASDDAAQFDALLASNWARAEIERPWLAESSGNHRYDDRWPDRSFDAIARSHADDEADLQRLESIDRGELDPERQLDYDLFGTMLRDAIDGYAQKAWLAPLSHQGGIQTAHEMLERMRFDDRQSYENWIARLTAFGTYVDQTIALMKAGIENGRVPPRVILQRVGPQIAAQRVSSPEDSPFFAPFDTIPGSFGPDERDALRKRGAQAIERVVLPAYARLQAFYQNSYLPAAPDAIGVSVRPGGKAWYAWAVRHYTTTDLSPGEIHQIGLDEVARIDEAMRSIMAQTGFDGDVPAFFAYLRSDPRFFLPDAAALVETYRAIAKRIDPGLPALFGTLPRLTYGVREIPMSSAPDTTTAYYYPGSPADGRPGWYYVNTYKPESRPTWEMEALTAHESVPGHHLQIALQQELGDVPPFRRYQVDFTAFVEGWALYAESLGDDLGLYQDPYSRFGQLSYQMWRAVRLVVDTGMHSMGWTRQEAIDYFMAHAPKAELDIVNEIDRYIDWPGQALAYKVGELRIKALRAEAESALGDDFDLRSFHDVVLGAGAIPLDLLQTRVHDWIRQQRDDAPSDPEARAGAPIASG